jgi:hypothetical protein
VLGPAHMASSTVFSSFSAHMPRPRRRKALIRRRPGHAGNPLTNRDTIRAGGVCSRRPSGEKLEIDELSEHPRRRAAADRLHRSPNAGAHRLASAVRRDQ